MKNIAFVLGVFFGLTFNGASLFSQTWLAKVEHAIVYDEDSNNLRQLINEATETSAKNVEGFIWLMEGQIVSQQGDYDTAREKWLEAERFFNIAGNKRGEMLANRCLMSGYMVNKNLEEAEQYIKRAIVLSNELNNMDILGQALIYMSVVKRFNNQNDSAFYYTRRAKAIFEESKNKNGIGDALVRLGVIHHYADHLDSAAYYYLEALRVFEEIENEFQVASLKNNLGIVFNQMGQYDKAFTYLRQSAAVKKKLNDYLGLGDNYQGIGNLHLALESIDSAQLYFELSQDLYEQGGDNRSLTLCLNNLGYCATQLQDHSLALAYYKEAYELSVQLRDTYELCGLATNIGYSLLDLGRTDEAKQYFEEGLQLAARINSLDQKAEAEVGMCDYYLEIEDYEKALDHYVNSVEFSKQILDETKTRQFAEMQTKYETEKKEKEIARLDREKAEADLRIAKQRGWIIGILLGSIILVATLIFIYFSRKRRQEILSAKRELEFQKQISDATVLAQEEERQRIAKDLHDGLVQSLAVLKLGVQNAMNKVGLSEAQKPEFSEHLHQIDEAANEARNISHQMMPRALMESGLVIALDDMLAKSLGNGNLEYRFEHFDLADLRFKTSIEVSLYRICQELVNNIIKHSGAKRVEVQLFKTKTHLILHVEDDGVGFDLSDRQKQSGIGLSNIFSRASAVDGDVSYEKGQPLGTIANVRVPFIT